MFQGHKRFYESNKEKNLFKESAILNSSYFNQQEILFYHVDAHVKLLKVILVALHMQCLGVRFQKQNLSLLITETI